MNDWTIEAEILGLCGDDSLQVALQRSGILAEQEKFVGIRENAKWRRGGAETYVYDFSILGTSQETRLFAKALVSLTPGVSPDDQLFNWLSRRASLKAAGCSVPRLFFAGKALLIEQYLDQNLETVLSSSNHKIVRSAAQVANSVLKAGFQPTTFIPNMRAHQNTVYWVDFGHDLGSDGQRPKGTGSLINTFCSELEKWVERDTIHSILRTH